MGVPYLTAYGVAGLVGVSRIIDQQHWLTDVVTGAVVGTTAAHVAYVCTSTGWAGRVGAWARARSPRPAAWPWPPSPEARR